MSSTGRRQCSALLVVTAQCCRGGGLLPPPDIVHYWQAAVRCVAEIHAQGIIHFDLKPENLLLVGGNLKIIDFGSSLVLPAGRDSVEVASVRGTETFLAPECYDSELVGGSGQAEERSFVTRLRSAEWQQS